MRQVILLGFAVAGAFANLAFFDFVYHLVAIVALTSAVTKESSVVRYERDRPFEHRYVAVAPMVSRPSEAA